MSVLKDSKEQSLQDHDNGRLMQPAMKRGMEPAIKPALQPMYLKKSNKQPSETNLPDPVMEKMESSFAEDFSDVNIQENSTKAEDLGAKAFTQGKEVHFAPGEFQPNSQEGQELIGHELTHVVQQKEGKVQDGEVHGKDIVNQDVSLEKEANEAGKLASEGKTVEVKGSGWGVQRKEKETLPGGQMTMEAENVDLGASKIHYPGGDASGVTLGFGFDLGSKSIEKAKAAMTEAGISAAQVTLLLKAVGKKGSDAEKFVKEYANSIGSISAGSLKKLFEISRKEHFEDMRATATSNKASISGDNYLNARAREVKDKVPQGTYVMSEIEFNGLHPAIIEFMLDLSYMGGFYKYQRVASINKILKANLNNPLAQLKALRTYMSSDEMEAYNDIFGGEKYNRVGYEKLFGEDVTIQIGERRRQVIRLLYLNKVISILEAGKEVEISGIESIQEKTSPNIVSSDTAKTATATATNEAPPKPVDFTGTPVYEALPEAASTLTFAVGAAGAKKYTADIINYVPEIKLVQTKLHDLGLLSDEEYESESSVVGETTFTPSNQTTSEQTIPLLEIEKKCMLVYGKIPVGAQVSESEIARTIAAIRIYQTEVMSSTADGRISAGGNTWLSMNATTKEQVVAAREKYKAVKKKEADAKKKRQEEEKRQAEYEVHVKASEAKILDPIKNYPLDSASVESKYKEFQKSESNSAEIKLFAKHNPELIKKMLKLAGNDSDDLAEKITQNLFLDELRSLDKGLLEELQSALESGWETDAEEKQRKRIDKVLEERPKEEVKTSKLTNLITSKSKGEDSTKSDAFKKQEQLPLTKISASVGKGGVNKASDVKIIQFYMVKFGYLLDSNEINFVASKKNDDVLKDSEIPKTIVSIQEYSINGLGGVANSKIDPGKTIEANIHSRVNQINSYANYTVGTKSIAPVLQNSQWVTQFRNGWNFKLGGEIDETQIDEVIRDIGLDGKEVKLKDGSTDKVVYTSTKIRKITKRKEFSVPSENALKEEQKKYKGKGNYVCCFDAADAMLVKGGGKQFNVHPEAIPTLSQAEFNINMNNSNKILGQQAILGIKYIDDLLQKGKPVMVGIDKGNHEGENSDKTTEHWLIIVGKVVIGNKVFYRFFDPGAITLEGGTGESNLFFLGEDNSLTKMNGNIQHTLSNIRSK
jgi:hypothetical protein